MRILLVAIVALALSAPPALAAYTCEVVAKRDDLDPDGAPLTNRMRDSVAVNDDGDVVFVARPAGGRDRLYDYPNGGASTVLAEAGAAAPGGLEFKTGRVFDEIGTNNFQDLLVRGRLTGGAEGVFGRAGAGALKKFAATGDASPCGDVFDDFPAVASRLSGGGFGGFVGRASDGTTGVVEVDLILNTLTCLMEEGDTIDGRLVCEFLDVGYSNANFNVAARATTVPAAGDCAVDGPVATILTPTDVVALEGDPSPVVGADFSGFDGEPSVLGTEVSFRGTLTDGRDAVFRHPSGGPTTISTAENDPAPDVGGAFRRLENHWLTNSGVVVNSLVKGGSTKTGVFTETEAAVTKSDAPPFGEKYRGLAKRGRSSTSVDGSVVALQVGIKDTVKPKNKHAILRCTD